jgi:hypothetical protein
MASEYKQYMDRIYGWEIIIQGKSNDELNEIIELVSRLEAKGIVSYPHPKTEIVTCKECKYYRNGLEHCTNWVMQTNEDFYCADAERKE